MVIKKAQTKLSVRSVGGVGDSIQTPSDRIRAVLVEIKRIRTLFKEIASNYVSKMEARVVELIQLVETHGRESQDQIPPMLKRVRELHVKPNKGRRKDLKQLELLVEDLWKMAEEMEEKREKALKGSSKQDQKDAGQRGKNHSTPKNRGTSNLQPATRAIKVPA